MFILPSGRLRKHYAYFTMKRFLIKEAPQIETITSPPVSPVSVQSYPSILKTFGIAGQ
jgi:hypothetical protein